MGRDCASERVPIALAEGRPEDPPAPAELWDARALHPDQPQNNVAVAFTQPAHRSKSFDNRSVQPDHASALGVRPRS